MNNRLYVSLCVLTLLSAIGLQAQSPKYIRMDKPFSSSPVFGTPVGKVARDAIQVPIITWAADSTVISTNDGTLAKNANSKLAEVLGVPTSIVLQDVFTDQIRDYVSGKSPFLRGTLGVINLAAEGLVLQWRQPSNALKAAKTLREMFITLALSYASP